MAVFSKKNKNKADIDINEDLDDFGADDDFGEEIQPKKKRAKSKKEKTLSERDGVSESSGKGPIIAFIFVLFLLIGFLIGILVFNLFGLRDNQLRGVLEKVPVVNNMLPPRVAQEPVLQMTSEELLAEIAALKAANEELATEEARLNALNETYLKEIGVLKEFERNQLQFKKDKEAFDNEVGLTNPERYEVYYKQISPENAENIYREVVGINNESKEFKSFVSTYENMDETSAARIFDQTVRTDLDLVVSILQNISSEHRAAIVAAMTTNAAEQVTRRMAPQ